MCVKRFGQGKRTKVENGEPKLADFGRPSRGLAVGRDASNLACVCFEPLPTRPPRPLSSAATRCNRKTRLKVGRLGERLHNWRIGKRNAAVSGALPTRRFAGAPLNDHFSNAVFGNNELAPGPPDHAKS